MGRTGKSRGKFKQKANKNVTTIFHSLSKPNGNQWKDVWKDSGRSSDYNFKIPITLFTRGFVEDAISENFILGEVGTAVHHVLIDWVKKIGPRPEGIELHGYEHNSSRTNFPKCDPSSGCPWFKNQSNSSGMDA